MKKQKKIPWGTKLSKEIFEIIKNAPEKYGTKFRSQAHFVECAVTYFIKNELEVDKFVTCPHCGHITVSDIPLKREWKGHEKISFTCPGCNKIINY
jgi:transposase-like protein